MASVSPVVSTSQSSSLSRPPWTGLFAFVPAIIAIALGHSFVVLIHKITVVHSPLYHAVSWITGFLGFALMWAGFKRDELQATWLGFIGGTLIWCGWFEWTWEFFSHQLQLQPVFDGDLPILNPALVLMEATSVILLASLVIFGANKDTRCRMFMWFHRNFKLRPDKPTPGYKRQFSRIVAMEMVFLTWGIYIINILIYDPRIFGPTHPVAMVAVLSFTVWGGYLIWKLSQQRGFAPALRYAIPTAYICWFPVESYSRMGFYPEIWIKPLEYPILMSLAFIVFVAAGVVMLNGRQGASEPEAA